jgi:hypothetical protein
VVLGSLFSNAYLLGEIIPMTQVIHLQIDEGYPIVYAPLWQQSNYFEYKLLGTVATDPDILLIGSSRAMYFRANLVNTETHFYNASVQAASIEQLSSFIKTIIERDIIPDLIIVNLDFPDFNSSRPDSRRELELPAFPNRSSFLALQRAGLLSTWSLWREGTTGLNWEQIPQDDIIFWGIHASQRHNGFVYDGSRYITGLLMQVDEGLSAHQTYLAERSEMYAIGNRVDMEAIQSLESALELAKAHDIIVVGLLLPYHPDFLPVILEDPDFDYIDLALEALQTLFKQYDFPLANYMDVKSYGGYSTEMQDGWHIGELASMKIYVQLLQDYPDIFAKYTDLAQLQQAIETADNPFVIREPFK